MARVCEVCGKRPLVGNKVSHSNIKSKKRSMPNLQSVRALWNGSVQKIRVCTGCLRSNKVKKAPRSPAKA